MNGLSRWMKLILGAITIVGTVLGLGAWANSLNTGLHEIADGLQERQKETDTNQKAIVKIAEQVIQHISEERYQDCFDRGIPPKECPPPGSPLPKKRDD